MASAVPEPDGDGWVRCPDPACDTPFEYPEHLVLQGLTCVPGHVDPAGEERCWLGGYLLSAAQQMIAMRLENNGRLTRAAHP